MSNLHSRLRALVARPFVRNVAVLASGTALGQLLAVAISPLLTRLYTPQDFGVLAVYAAVVAIVVVAASLRYELAIPLPDDETEGFHLLVLSLFLVVACAVLATVTLALFGDQLAFLPQSSDFRPYLWLVPLGILGAGSYQALTYWGIRTKLYGWLARTRVSQSIGQALSQLGLGVVTTGPMGLIVGQLIGQTAGTGTLALQALRRRSRSFSPRMLIDLAKRYRRFPIFSSGAALVNSSGLYLPPLLLAALYGPQVAGWYALAERIIRLPLTLIGQAVAQVFLGEAAKLARQDPEALLRLFSSTAKHLLLIGFAPILGLGVSGPWLFGFVFGVEWQEAGHYVQILALMLLLRFVAMPLSQTLTVLERQPLQLAWDVYRLTAVAGSLLGAHAMGFSATHALALYSANTALAYLVLLWLSHYALKRSR